jgi:hypothetical protein
MNSAITSTVLLTLMLATATCAEINPWLNHPRWDEGLAEIALYDGKLNKYGSPRDASVDLITVREYFHPERFVKTAAPTVGGVNSLPVMKQNFTRRIRTGIYEYVQAGSAFVDRISGDLLKISAISTEWCGNSSALLVCDGRSRTLQISNYMDDRGFNLHSLDTSDDLLFYDQLILYFRIHAHTLQPGTSLRIADTLISNNPVFKVRTAVISSIERSTFSKESNGNQILITIDFEDRAETFLFEDNPLRNLTRWESDRGEWLALRKTFFLDYWNLNRPGDEKLLQ